MSEGFGSLISVAPVLMPGCTPASYRGLPTQSVLIGHWSSFINSPLHQRYLLD